jgi:hypothetical protein
MDTAIQEVFQMTGSTIDLGNLLNFIIDQKNVRTTVDIEPKCKVNAQDPKPLIKIINYLINYLNQITDEAITISLNTQSSGCLLCFIVSTNVTKLPSLSDNLDDALKPYNAAIRVVFEEGKYVQIILYFGEDHVPDTVIIEV